MSQQELADLSEISKKTIQRIENGRLNPSLDTLLCIASGFKIEFRSLADFSVPVIS
jgi:DNA-binding XRE family transcriptional regulator